MTSMAAFMGSDDASVKEAGKVLLDGSFLLRTYGNPERTRAFMLLHAFADPLAATKSDSRAIPAQIELGLPYLQDLAVSMGESFAGENGWFTQMRVKALGASKAQANYYQAGQKPEAG